MENRTEMVFLVLLVDSALSYSRRSGVCFSSCSFSERDGYGNFSLITASECYSKSFVKPFYREKSSKRGKIFYRGWCLPLLEGFEMRESFRARVQKHFRPHSSCASASGQFMNYLVRLLIARVYSRRCKGAMKNS
jgi:hypothetical protein